MASAVYVSQLGSCPCSSQWTRCLLHHEAAAGGERNFTCSSSETHGCLTAGAAAPLACAGDA